MPQEYATRAATHQMLSFLTQLAAPDITDQGINEVQANLQTAQITLTLDGVYDPFDKENLVEWLTTVYGFAQHVAHAFTPQGGYTTLTIQF